MIVAIARHERGDCRTRWWPFFLLSLYTDTVTYRVMPLDPRHTHNPIPATLGRRVESRPAVVETRWPMCLFQRVNDLLLVRGMYVNFKA